VKRYKYKAKDAKNNLVTGEVEAKDERSAAKLVRDQGLIVISITSGGIFSLDIVKGFSERISITDVTNFTRQLATMINAGLPITEALLILRSQSNPALQRIVSRILADVEDGQALSNALSKNPNVFSKTYIALIKSGELGGVLDEVLVRLSEDMEKKEELRAKVKGAMIYPAIIMVGMVLVGLIMVIFVIPQLSTLYDQFGAELPMSTKFLIGLSDFTLHYWPIEIIIAIGAFVAFDSYRKSDEGKVKLDELIFKIPVVGDLQKQIILTDITRTLSLMISSGVQLIEGLTITADVVSNSVIKFAVQDIIKLVEKGFPLAFSFSRHPEAFPFILSQMVSVGEETGKMDEVMKKVSHVFETEADQKVKALTAAMEPAILIILGVGVAFLVVSIILPIYNLTSSFNI
jgi:type IV pilus assembly protein PilC